MGDFHILRGQVLCLIAAVEACETTNGRCTYDLIDTGPGRYQTALKMAGAK